MNKYIPIVFVSDTCEISRRKADIFIQLLKGSDIVDHVRIINKMPFEIIIGGYHLYFMSDSVFRRWCKGRVYIDNGVLCHSGHPVRTPNSELITGGTTNES